MEACLAWRLALHGGLPCVEACLAWRLALHGGGDESRLDRTCLPCHRRVPRLLHHLPVHAVSTCLFPRSGRFRRGGDPVLFGYMAQHDRRNVPRGDRILPPAAPAILAAFTRLTILAVLITPCRICHACRACHAHSPYLPRSPYSPLVLYLPCLPRLPYLPYSPILVTRLIWQVPAFRDHYVTPINDRTPRYYCVRVSFNAEHIKQLCDPTTTPDSPLTGRMTGVVRATVEELWNDMKRGHYIDMRTRSVTITLQLRSNHVGVRYRINLLFELTSLGAIFPSYDVESRVIVDGSTSDMALYANLALAMIAMFALLEAVELTKEGPRIYFQAHLHPGAYCLSTLAYCAPPRAGPVECDGLAQLWPLLRLLLPGGDPLKHARIRYHKHATSQVRRRWQLHQPSSPCLPHSSPSPALASRRTMPSRNCLSPSSTRLTTMFGACRSVVW